MKINPIALPPVPGVPSAPSPSAFSLLTAPDVDIFEALLFSVPQAATSISNMIKTRLLANPFFHFLVFIIGYPSTFCVILNFLTTVTALEHLLQRRWHPAKLSPLNEE